MIRQLRHALQAGVLNAVVAHCHRRSRGDRQDLLELGRGLGRTLWTVFPAMRNDVITSLGHVVEAADPAALALDVFENQLGVNTVDSIMAWQDFRQHPFPVPVTLHGEASLAEALRQKRGVVLVSGHYGNWELLSQWLGHQGYPIHSVQRLHRNPRLHAAMSRWRGANGARLVDFHRRRPESFRECLDCLKRGEILGLLIDVAPKARSLEVDFLGKRYDVPRGPALMAMLTGALVVPAFCERHGEGYRITFETPREPPVRGENRDQAVELLTRDLVNVLESRIRESPEHWTWILDAWRRRPFSALSSSPSESC